MKNWRREKIRKLYALARDKGAFKHEAESALAKAQELEAKTPTAKAIAHAIEQFLRTRGLVVRVRRRQRLGEDPVCQELESKIDVDVNYFYRVHRWHTGEHHQFEIKVIEYK